MARLTPLSKGLITIVILGAVGAGVYTKREVLFPPKPHDDARVPPKAALPGEGGGAATPAATQTAGTIPAIPEGRAGCANLPEVRFYHWAWNAQMGLMLATGGKQAVDGSLMCKYGVNLKLIREDNTDQMQSLMLAFAEKLKAGEDNPAKGAHFIAIMGDGSGAFFKATNDALMKLGPEYTAAVVGAAGFSRGEDKFMGPQAWKDNPQAARGGVVAGVLRDGDWNIAMKWLGDNGIPNNPDESTYDPDALNWVNASDYIDAAQKYVSGFCADLKDVKSGKTEKKCVRGVVTWTPGDVTVAENKGGLVSIVSTQEYRSQMPCVIIGNRKWIDGHKEIVKGMLRAIAEAGDMIKKDDAALRKAAAVSALVYAEKDPDYWYKFFTVRTVPDKQGINVQLGGSSVNNLADMLHTFGLARGSTNVFAATYQVFGGIVTQQYPKLVPKIYPWEQVVDLTALKELQAEKPDAGAADMPTFNTATTASATTSVVSKKAWDIQFATGKAEFTPRAADALQQLLKDLVIAGGTTVEIHGHTDGVGGVDANMQLSENRAFAVAQWLRQKAPTAFPEGRIRVFAHGSTQPLAPNSTPEGRARNRRVEIVLGTNL